MVTYLGDFSTTETVRIPFNTFTSDDPCASCTITNLAAGDVEIHKDGSTTQRASDSGVTVSIDFDGVTGNHLISIDLSDNTDAGFYAAGSRYTVRIEGTTVDGGTINAWIGSFSIGCVLRATTAGRTLDVASTGEAGLDFNNINDAAAGKTLTNITVPVVTSVTNRVTANTDQIEGADATNQIRDSIVDDSTRIDASALNALSAKAPSKNYLTGSDNSDGDIEMDEATGNYPGSVASVAGAVNSLTTAPLDSAGITTLLGRVIGTLLAGNHTAQSGDNYPIVNHADYGNAQLVRSTTPANKLTVDTNGQVGVANIAVGSSGISTVAESFTLSTGSQVNTYTATQQRDGTYHQLSDTAGTLDGYYQLDIGATGIPSAITIYGRATGLNDPINVYAFNWGTSLWDQIGTMPGASANAEYTMSTYSSHVGTTTNDGKVRIRFYNTGLTSATLYIDQLYVSYSVVQSSVGYANGAIWIDTVNGFAGAVVNVNGVADYPVDNITDANSLAASLGISRFYVKSGSSITLVASQTNQQFDGCNWTLALGGQDISGSRFYCAKVSGIATGTTQAIFEDCEIGAVTLPPCVITHCGIGSNSGTFTAGSAGQFVFYECFSLVPGSGTPVFNFAGLGSTTGINNRSWFGGSNYTLDSNCTLSHEVVAGGGQTFTTGGASVELRGIYRAATYVLSGAGTVQQVGTCGIVTISGTATTTVNIYGVISSLANTSSGTTVNNFTVSYTDTSAILADTNEMQGKLPTNNIIGSSDKDNHDTDIDTLLTRCTALRLAELDPANLPTDIASVKSDTASILVDTNEMQGKLPSGTISSLTLAQIIAGISDGSLDLQEMLRIIFASVAGKTTNNGLRFRDSADTKDRIIATLDASKNRTSMTYDGS